MNTLTMNTPKFKTRHFLPAYRWHVVSSPDGLLRNSYLSSANAKQMFKAGDFYPDGTCIEICTPLHTVMVWVKVNKLYLDAECQIEADKELTG